MWQDDINPYLTKHLKDCCGLFQRVSFFVSIVIIGNSDPSNSNTTLPLRDFPLKFITPLKYQMLRLKKTQNIPK